MTLAELKSKIAQRISDGGMLTLTSDVSGPGALADFIQTLPSKSVNLSEAGVTLIEDQSMGSLLVKGVLKDDWILTHFGKRPLKNVNITFQFTKAPKGEDAISSNMSCTAEVLLCSTPELKINLQGSLVAGNKLLFAISPPAPGFSPLSSILGFTDNENLLDYFPSIDVFKQGRITTFNMSYGFGPTAAAALTLALDMGTDWSITDNIGIKKIGLVTTVNNKLRSDDAVERSFDAAASGIIHIGQDFATTIILQNATQWYLELKPNNGNILPSLADVCDLAGGASLWQSVQEGLNSLKISGIAIDGVKIGFDYAAKKVIYFSLTSHITLAGVRIDTQTQLLPDFRFDGRLAPGHDISLKSIIQHYFGASDDFPEINVSQLSLLAWPNNKYYKLDISLSSDWSFPIANGKAITLQEVTAFIKYAKEGTSGSVSVLFTIAGIGLYLSAAYEGSGKGWLFKTSSYGIGDPVPIGSIFKELGDYFGIGLPKVLTNATITDLNLSFNTHTKDFAFNYLGNLPICSDADEIAFTMAVTHNKNSYSKKIGGKLTINENIFTFALDADDAATRLAIKYEGQITLEDVAKTFTLGQVSIPGTLNRFRFNDLDVSLDTKSGNKQFKGTGTVIINDATEVDLALNMEREDGVDTFSGTFELEMEGFKTPIFLLEFVKEKDGYHTKLALNFTVSGVDVVLNANASSTEKDGVKTTDKSFSGGTKGLNVKVSALLDDLLQKIFPGYRDVIPPDFLPDFIINDIFVSYSGQTGELNLLAATTIAGKAIKFFFNYTPKVKSDPRSVSRYAFGIETEVTSLGGLPLVGEQLKEVSFSNGGFVYTSAAGQFAIPSLSTADEKAPALVFGKPRSYEKGFNLIGELKMGAKLDPLPLLLPLVSSGGKVKDTALPLTTNTAPAFLPGVKWINVDKGVGPVKLNKIGVSFSTEDKKLALLINAQLAMSGITFSVEGLGLAFLPLSLFKGEHIEPEFRLSGLGLAVSKGPLDISGMFAKVTPGPDEDLAFYGTAKISTSKFGISGIGSYSQGKKGVAFFIYAMYNGPIGGPSFFFVTGIAAGFGYNKKVRLPEVQQVKKFPLVAMALSGGKGESILDVLNELIEGKWIETSYGDCWLAVGIKFSSFKIVDSFVLLVVEFGAKLEFTVMGLSLLKWPDKGSAIVYVELAILARFGPHSDVIAVQAVLTPNSYVFDPNCKLTGGFAFYTWISGPHEGDFVITLGGYHPRYAVPDHYPKVDRLALNWKISSIVSITGEMYYALTPNAIMAGGLWKVMCDLSFLKASVAVYADVLISWAPFYYRVDGGVSVSIQADIKILFVSIHFSLSMGAEVHIWGPPFAGEIYVDWSIFSFSIPFGSSGNKPPEALKWKEFADKFVPQKDKAAYPLDTRIAAGIIDTIQDEHGNPIRHIIDPYNLVVSVDSFFPVKELYADDKQQQALPEDTWVDVAGQDMPAKLSDQQDGFGIKPMNIPSLTTQLTAYLVRIDHSNAGEAVADNIRFMASAKGMASALWADESNTDPVIKNVPAGIQLHTSEAADDTIISVDLNAYMEKGLSPQLMLLRNGDAGTKMDAAEIARLISGNINNPVRGTVTNDLLALGFDLPEASMIHYETLEMENPFYLAAIGQNIPDIIKA